MMNGMRTLAAVVVSGGLLVGACSASSSGGTGGGGGQGASSSGGTGAGSGASGGAPAGGSGGGIVVTDSGSGGGVNNDSACSAIGQKAENKLQPADIVFALDNSGSMNQEAQFVQTHMNTFSTGIIQSNIDANVVIIAAASNQSNGVCIAPPLGSGQCPNDDKPPNYLHVKQSVGSTNALSMIVNLFSQYQSMLRQGASKHFIVVTDDNSSMSASAFDQAIVPLLQGVDPLYTKYVMHAIYGFTKPNNLACFANPQSDPCCDKALPGNVLTADVGSVYATLIQQTGGIAGNLCLQDFLPVFQAVSQSVVQGAQLACEWNIPPPDGGSLDPTLVNVEFTANGSTQKLGYVASPGDCANVQGGWYYDNPSAPTKVLVCPQTCQVIQGVPNAEVQILFGCASEPAVPK